MTNLSHLPSLHQLACTALLERGFEPEFSTAISAQILALQAQPTSPADQLPADHLRDLRHLLWCSIDNDDSRDLDQLTVATPGLNGATNILVAIADVQFCVPLDSPLDVHARLNTTSVYTAAGVFPMLAPELSTGLTSLNQGQDRRAVVIEMSVAPNGEITQSDLYAAWVHNHAQLTYNSVAAWLDGQALAPQRLAAVPGLADQLQTQWVAAKTLQNQREQQGALSLRTPQTRPVFVQGVLTDFCDDQDNCAKDMIASFMIAANGVAARYLEGKRFPCIRRFLREPSRWQRIRDLAKQRGTVLPLEPTALALNEFLASQQTAAPQHFADLCFAVVKLLGSGEYTLVQPGAAATGHFGLAVNDYTHATAPNRRYVDLTTQRLLSAALQGHTCPLDEPTLNRITQHCNEQQKSARKVERQIRKSAAALLLQSRIGQYFDAIITGASSKGVWLRTDHPRAEGRLLEPQPGLEVGDRLRVQLMHIQVEHGFIDFK
jgi:VacB/RNase II family 3'-5' exoribonuclease